MIKNNYDKNIEKLNEYIVLYQQALEIFNDTVISVANEFKTYFVLYILIVVWTIYHTIWIDVYWRWTWNYRMQIL